MKRTFVQRGASLKKGRLLGGYRWLIEGNTENPEKLTIFLPGLGVNMFGSTKTGGRAGAVLNSYQNILPDNYLSLFIEMQDYPQEDLRISNVLTFERQANRLRKILEVILNKFSISSLSITAQSIGCHTLVAAFPYLRGLRLEHLALWAPSTYENDVFAERITGEFLNRSGTRVDFKAETRLMCRDGKTVIIERTFWDSLRRNGLKKNLRDITNAFSSVILFFASDDKLCFGGEDYFREVMSRNCRIFTISGSSHTFRDENMQLELCRRMKQDYFGRI